MNGAVCLSSLTLFDTGGDVRSLLNMKESKNSNTAPYSYYVGAGSSEHSINIFVI